MRSDPEVVVLRGAPCPTVVDYAPAFQDRLADELLTLPEDSALAVAMSDYAGMRDQGRVCRDQ